MESKRKHLIFIQDTIKRMANNSFLLRGWSVTLIVATLALAGSSEASAQNYAIVAVALVIIFWLLDAYYLSQERQFRALYDEVRLKDKKEIDFSMNTKKFAVGRNSWLHSVIARIFLVFYGGISLLILALVLSTHFEVQIIINKI